MVDAEYGGMQSVECACFAMRSSHNAFRSHFQLSLFHLVWRYHLLRVFSLSAKRSLVLKSTRSQSKDPIAQSDSVLLHAPPRQYATLMVACNLTTICPQHQCCSVTSRSKGAQFQQNHFREIISVKSFAQMNSLPAIVDQFGSELHSSNTNGSIPTSS